MAGAADYDLPHPGRHALSLPLAGRRCRQHADHRRHGIGQNHLGGVPDRDDGRARPCRGARPQARLGPADPPYGRRLRRARGRGAAPRTIEGARRHAAQRRVPERPDPRLHRRQDDRGRRPPPHARIVHDHGAASRGPRARRIARFFRLRIGRGGHPSRQVVLRAASSAGSSMRRSTPSASGN